MGDAEIATDRYWPFNVVLSAGAIILASVTPETLAGNIGQLVLMGFMAFVMFQAGVIYQLAHPVPRLYVFRFHVFLGVFLIGLYLLAEGTGTRILDGAMIAMNFFVSGGVWCYWQQRDKP